MSDEMTIEQAMAALKSDNIDERIIGVKKISEAKYADVVPQLFSLLREKYKRNAELDLAILKALEKICNTTSIPLLLEIIAEPDYYINKIASKLLGKIGDKSVVPSLVKILGSEKDFGVRVSTIYALGHLKCPDAIPTLADLLNDDNREIRSTAAYALGEIGDKSALPTLYKALEDIESMVRSEAAGALGYIGDKHTVPLLIHALTDSAHTVRWSAAAALGQLKDDSAIEPLCNAMNDVNLTVRTWAVSSLRELGYNFNSSELAKIIEDEKLSLCR
jgi:HEAT repeat protein